tara:strand:- start:1338 stop:1799 length:462 start_codon:yes stop_codon:yes gene_type:complete
MIKQGTYAGFVPRFMAVVLDTLILYPLAAILAGVMGGATLLSAIALLLLQGFYYALFLSGPWQATPGKRLLKLYVVFEDGSKLNAEAGFARFLAYSMPGMPMYATVLDTDTVFMLVLWLCFAWFLPITFTQQRTGMHDLLCRTRVINGKAEEI